MTKTELFLALVDMVGHVAEVKQVQAQNGLPPYVKVDFGTTRPLTILNSEWADHEVDSEHFQNVLADIKEYGISTTKIQEEVWKKWTATQRQEIGSSGINDSHNLARQYERTADFYPKRTEPLPEGFANGLFDMKRQVDLDEVTCKEKN